MLVIFSLKNVKTRPQTRANIFICLLDHAYEVLNSFSSHTADYLFMFQNGLDRKDAIFVIVPL